MPIWLRKYTFKNIQTYYKEASEAAEANTSSAKTKDLFGPDISPSYSTKASK